MMSLETPNDTTSASGGENTADSVTDAAITIYAAIESHADNLSTLIENGLALFPTEAEILHVAALVALMEGQPNACLGYQKRLAQRYELLQKDHFLYAIALGQKKQWAKAVQIVTKYRILTIKPGNFYANAPRITKWIAEWMAVLRAKAIQTPGNRPGDKKTVPVKQPAKSSGKKVVPGVGPKKNVDPPTPEIPELPQFAADIPIHFSWPEGNVLNPPAVMEEGEDFAWFRLRGELINLSLLQGFDELLCLSHLHQVDTYWYQVETVRKVLRQFRGRVLLADEVGLGKTIEAGMVLKEYLLRGMADRVLILTPASLVGQWQEEMESKFGLSFESSYNPLLRTDPQAFWGQKRIIASVAAARRDPHFSILAQQNFDLVIVDEAHHLKNRNTMNWKLVDALQKRFLILLSATPVQNSLVELYNLLTLLKPGIFKTEKEFRNAYMTPGKPRVPSNRQQLRDLMREVMIRNTRSLVDVRLPPRHAVTIRLDAEGEERACYETLTRLISETHGQGENHHRMALHHLLTAAGSSPAACAAATGRFVSRNQEDVRWKKIHKRYQSLGGGVKEKALLELLRRNPSEKKMVFVHHRETMEQLDRLLKEAGILFVRFDGSMGGPAKDAAIDSFKDHAPVLLCTESGGEGRNVQFCNTLINFDLPWNPMTIEQRIGRIHRIGQVREVFIFNLVVRNTVEDHVLQILDEKINMFELVVGEVDAILGEMDDQKEFAEMVYSAWVETTENQRTSAFIELGNRMATAKARYEDVKALDTNLFGQEFETG
ncbi:MAG: DEAD/DEAH box helicase family protein [Magnetococcales bacterium]|nr:DEAD/DEAH box helicase family protein [Magnetococcales bacterium]